MTKSEFICDVCDHIIYTSKIHRFNGTTVCKDCYDKELKQLLLDATSVMEVPENMFKYYVRWNYSKSQMYDKMVEFLKKDLVDIRKELFACTSEDDSDKLVRKESDRTNLLKILGIDLDY